MPSEKDRERDLDREIRDHLEIEAEEQRDRGLSPNEANEIADRLFGNTTLIKEDVRETWRLRWLDRLWQDLKYASRVLKKNPSFTMMAILTLGLSIGATTAIFSQVNAVFWKLLPVQRPQQLRTISWTSAKRAFDAVNVNTPMEPGTTIQHFAYPVYANIRDHTTTLSSVACWQDPGENRPLVINDHGRVQGQFVSGNYFSMTGTLPIIGRNITGEDDREGAAAVVMISARLWQREFNGDPSVVGQSININDTAFTVIGVMPGDFFGLDPSSVPDIMIPIQPALATLEADLISQHLLTNDRYWGTCGTMVGRLKPGISDEQVRAEIEGLVAQTILSNPPSQSYELPHVWLNSAAEGTGPLRQAIEQPLLVLLALVTAVLLLACTNIAGLLLARGTSREKEIATRLAIGAPRGRIVRQLLSESVLTAFIGAALGLIIAFVLGGFSPKLINEFLPTAFGRDVGLNAGVDGHVLLFATTAAVLTGVLFGLIPALFATRLYLLAMLKQTGKATSTKRGTMFGSGTFVAVQVALSMLLLTGAGLFIHTVINLRTIPLGYDPTGLLMFRVEPRLSGYTKERRLEFFENALKQFQVIPGVAVASGSVIPIIANVNGQVDLSGSSSPCIRGFTPHDPSDLIVGFNSVAPRYFETIRQPILAGRDITWMDRQGAPRVILVNEAFARKFYGGKNPVGERIGCSDGMTIVGLVADNKNSPRRDVRPTFYPSYLQQPTNLWMTFVLRVTKDPMTLLPSVRGVINKLDPSVPILEAVTPVDLRNRMMSREQLIRDLLIFFGVLGLVLTCVGVYGMLNYMVTRRTSEIGIRMALGARRGDVIFLVIRESLIPVGLGMFVGVILSIALARLMTTMLFEVSSNDPWTIAAAALLLLLVAAAAALIPSRQASRVDPHLTLRHE